MGRRWEEGTFLVSCSLMAINVLIDLSDLSPARTGEHETYKPNMADPAGRRLRTRLLKAPDASRRKWEHLIELHCENEARPPSYTANMATHHQLPATWRPHRMPRQSSANHLLDPASQLPPHCHTHPLRPAPRPANEQFPAPEKWPRQGPCEYSSSNCGRRAPYTPPRIPRDSVERAMAGDELEVSLRPPPHPPGGASWRPRC